MNTTQSASAPASPKPPIGTGNHSILFASSGVASCRSSMGVMIAPGARALSRIPAPAHCGVTAVRRTQRLIAIFEAA